MEKPEILRGWLRAIDTITPNDQKVLIDGILQILEQMEKRIKRLEIEVLS